MASHQCSPRVQIADPAMILCGLDQFVVCSSHSSVETTDELPLHGCSPAISHLFITCFQEPMTMSS